MQNTPEMDYKSTHIQMTSWNLVSFKTTVYRQVHFIDEIIEAAVATTLLKLDGL